MKKHFLYLYLPLLFLSCGGSDDNNDSCNFLLNVAVSTSVNMNLFPYTQLEFPSNSAYVPNVGNGGIIITNTGAGFRAWDAADPNHQQSSCSILNIVGGVEGVCNCTEANTYSLFSGQPLNNPNLQCGLKTYIVEQNGNTLIIFN